MSKLTKIIQVYIIFRLIVCPSNFSFYEDKLVKLGYNTVGRYWNGNLNEHSDNLQWMGNNSDSLDDIRNMTDDAFFQKDFVIWEQPWIKIVPLVYLLPYFVCYEITNYTSNIIYMGSNYSYTVYLVDPRQIFD